MARRKTPKKSVKRRAKRQGKASARKRSPAAKGRSGKAKRVPPSPRKRKSGRSFGAKSVGSRKGVNTKRKKSARRPKSVTRSKPRPSKQPRSKIIRKDFGPASAEIEIQVYSGPRDWPAYDPARVVAEGVRAVEEVGQFVRAISSAADWEGLTACEVIWSNFMRNTDSPDRRGNWQGRNGEGGRSTAYTAWANNERRARGFFEDSARGERLRADGSQYRMMVLKVFVRAVRFN